MTWDRVFTDTELEASVSPNSDRVLPFATPTMLTWPYSAPIRVET